MQRKDGRPFEDMLEQTSQVVYLKRADGTYLFINREFERVSGLRREQVLGRHDREVFPKEIADVFIDQDRQVLEKGAPIEFDEMVTLPGGSLSFITTKFPLFDEDGKIWAVGGSCVDITARRRSEALLNEAEALAGIGSFEANVATRTTRRSPGLYRVFGVSPEEMDKKPEGVLAYVHPDDRERFGGFMRRVMAEGTAYSTEYRIIRPDGRERVIHVEGHAELGPDGKPARVFGWIQDVTERRALETKVLGIADHERRAIGEDLHDDLGQRLAGIALLTRALEQRLSGNGESEALRLILRELDATIAGVRELARGLQPLPAREGGLRRALEDLAANVSATSGADCRFESEPHAAVADSAVATQLYRIAQEALSNAIRHAAPKRVDIRLKKNGRALELSIADDGRGIGEPRADSGIGLSIMRHRASVINGALNISPRAGGGTLVSCSVPLKPAS